MKEAPWLLKCSGYFGHSILSLGQMDQWPSSPENVGLNLVHANVMRDLSRSGGEGGLLNVADGEFICLIKLSPAILTEAFSWQDNSCVVPLSDVIKHSMRHPHNLHHLQPSLPNLCLTNKWTFHISEYCCGATLPSFNAPFFNLVKCSGHEPRCSISAPLNVHYLLFIKLRVKSMKIMRGMLACSSNPGRKYGVFCPIH